jgi:hypothetical protein
MLQMVSKEKVKEMENLFVDTVERLTNRVHNLEKQGGGYYNGTSSSAPNKPIVGKPPIGNIKNSGIDGTNLAIDSTTTTGSGERVVRIEPGGRIRATPSTHATSVGNKSSSLFHSSSNVV